MAKMGFKNTSSNPYTYLEMPAGSGTAASSAIGLNNANGTFNISVNTSTGAVPQTSPKVTIDPSTNGNFTFQPNGTGGLVSPNTYGGTVGATNQVVIIDSTGLLGSSGGAGITNWVDVTGTTQAMANNTGYTANNAGLVTLTLPTTAAYGTMLRVCGKGAGGWKIAQNASQSIHYGVQTTTVGVTGFLASSAQYNTIELLCTVANLTWTELSAQGNITFN